MPQTLDLAAIQARHTHYLAHRSSRSCPAHPSADDVPALLAEVQRLTAENQRLTAACEARDIRIWLIEQTLQPIDIADDPAGIVGELAPWLDGPLHPDHVAAYRAALEG